MNLLDKYLPFECNSMTLQIGRSQQLFSQQAKTLVEDDGHVVFFFHSQTQNWMPPLSRLLIQKWRKNCSSDYYNNVPRPLISRSFPPKYNQSGSWTEIGAWHRFVITTREREKKKGNLVIYDPGIPISSLRWLELLFFSPRRDLIPFSSFRNVLNI